MYFPHSWLDEDLPFSAPNWLNTFLYQIFLMAYQNASDLVYPSRNYDTIISFMFTLAVLSDSLLISRRNKLRF